MQLPAGPFEIRGCSEHEARRKRGRRTNEEMVFLVNVGGQSSRATKPMVQTMSNVSSVSQCCREMRFIETKPKILHKKGFVFSVPTPSSPRPPNRAPIPGESGKRSGLRKIEDMSHISTSTPRGWDGGPWYGESGKRSESLSSRLLLSRPTGEISRSSGNT